MTHRLFLTATLCFLVSQAFAAEPPPIRVLVWDEQQPSQKQAYDGGFLGDTIAAYLAKQPGLKVTSVNFASPSQGLSDAELDAAQVIIWWGHVKHGLVETPRVEAVVQRVRDGRLGLVALHSAHWARPFVRLMQERAKEDALAQIPAAERATAKFEFFNDNPLGKVPRREAPLTPALRQEDGVWKLTLPGCIFPAYRNDGAPSHVKTLLPNHPIAKGLPAAWDIPRTEMYDEPFHVPKPDAVVFEERWDKGEWFRSGSLWKVGKGGVFYYRPGHETHAVFKQAENLRVIENATRYLAAQLPGKATATPPAKKAAAPKPNVLLITADDLRPELGCYGSPAITPHLDAIAARGTTFTRAYCQQAVCNPSRSSMLTGLRPGTLGLYTNGTHFRELKPDVTTLPLWFKEHGYTTRCTGKIFHNWHTKDKGDARSWSAPEFLHYANHGDDTPQVSSPLPENYAKHSEGFRKYGSVGMSECYDVPDEAYYDGRVAAEAVRILPELKKGGPFFLAVGFWKPHAPFNAPKKYWDLYDRAKIPPLNPARPAAAPEIAFHPSTEILGPRDNQKLPTAEQIAEMRHGYFAGISYMDAQIGKIIAALKEQGLLDNTIIVFWSDHGYHLGEHGLWAKTSNFELDARAPLIVSAPQAKRRGVKTHALVEMLDIFPTLNALCGLPPAPGLEGTSLVPVLENPAATVKPAAFTQHPRPPYPERTPNKQPTHMGYSVRTAGWRYTEWRNWKTGAVEDSELYDHTAAQPELHNVIANPPDKKALEESKKLLRAQFPVTK